jgi:uncharacterized membrane protein YgcG
MSTPLQAGQPGGIRQPEPPEGRKAIPFNTPIDFSTGNEVFEWKSNALGGAKPSAIMGAWVDATAFTSSQTLTIKVNNGLQTFQIQGGTQGYIIITAPEPFQAEISSGGATGLVTVVFYNYNPLFTGSVATSSSSPSQASGSGGGGAAPASSGGGGVRSGGGRAIF